MMTIEEFKEQVRDVSDLYLTDYFQPEIEFDFDDPDDPAAYITLKLQGDKETFVLTLRLDESGDLGVECGEDNYLHADDGGFFTALFFETYERLEIANGGLSAGKSTLESVKDRMDEHAYQELSIALNP